ncbi:Phospho-2-dehydro-3-deoxyheptonate aldolase, tyrosine-inhibited [Neolecta irregularis DAH-3]|uniref:3-deoxy-7-phosphoheptulonate synthase n=1 Tax=Neolecta irregularis (strain DAH-3) TaxID=1198029 RepID=A0A1U7LJK3_NEOID|nr:Phospho-2-dehydro-3-deoxyheptonate aldolase, tyrosine-inhibited [Neolecta irregularis DAH-3]|eukprot:OLL22846.1 Phospho-2-dehydro-3-deoxyheptonate aldolase, tyrosine-inhibited [Neolecta irregularis DAH-3]
MFDASGRSSPVEESAEDIRVEGYDPLIAPALLQSEIPETSKSRKTTLVTRKNVQKILTGKDDRLIIVVGPCSIHDTDAAIEYAKLLKHVSERLCNDLLIIMRAYLEKPRTIAAWKGMLNDPDMDGTCNINKGLRVSRQLFCDLTHMGVPIATEMLDTVSPQVRLLNKKETQN